MILLSRTYAHEHTWQAKSALPQINNEIPAEKIVSVVHERDEIGTLLITVYYREE